MALYVFSFYELGAEPSSAAVIASSEAEATARIIERLEELYQYNRSLVRLARFAEALRAGDHSNILMAIDEATSVTIV